MPILTPTTTDIIAQAAQHLCDGGLVALPTETVYGLGCDATNPKALATLYATKGRPRNHPVIVHIASVQQLSDWAMDIPDIAYVLAKAFWPGPLTLILTKKPHVLDAVTGGQDTVGLRIPNHPVALDLLNAFGRGVAAPSANRFGHVSPTTAAHVVDEFGDALWVLDGGPCTVGVESTIVDVSSGNVRILRPGMMTAEAIQQIAGITAKPYEKGGVSPRVSGNLTKHYAPTTPVTLMTHDDLIAAWTTLTSLEQATRGLITLDDFVKVHSPQHISLGQHPTGYAERLYAALRHLDTMGLTSLWVELPPQTGEWEAIHDRLKRCAAS